MNAIPTEVHSRPAASNTVTSPASMSSNKAKRGPPTAAMAGSAKRPMRASDRTPAERQSTPPDTPAADEPSESNEASGNSTATAKNAKRKATRVSRACDSCFYRKDRCDGALPVCKVCRDLDRVCTYARPERKRGPLQGVRQRLEAQVEILESVLGYLIDSFPTLSQEALRPLLLDDGEAFMRQIAADGAEDSKSSPSTSNGAGPSRLPAGDIYPQYSKAHAKQLWRQSHLAKSIAPSIGLRLGPHDDEEDLAESHFHRRRVDEAQRAREELLQHSLFKPSPPPTHSSPRPPPPNTMSMHGASHAQLPSSQQPYRRVTPMRSVAPFGNHHQASNMGDEYNAHFSMSAHSQPPQSSLSAMSSGLQHAHHPFPSALPSSHPHPHPVHPPSANMLPMADSMSRQSQSSAVAAAGAEHPSQAQSSIGLTIHDPFSAASWANDTFDLGDLGEDAHALAYALGLPAASSTSHGYSHAQAHQPTAPSPDFLAAAAASFSPSRPSLPYVHHAAPAASPPISGMTASAVASVPTEGDSVKRLSSSTKSSGAPYAHTPRSSGSHHPHPMQQSPASLHAFLMPHEYAHALSPTQQQQQPHHGSHHARMPSSSDDYDFPHDQASSILYQLGLQDSTLGDGGRIEESHPGVRPPSNSQQSHGLPTMNMVQ